MQPGAHLSPHRAAAFLLPGGLSAPASALRLAAQNSRFVRTVRGIVRYCDIQTYHS
jgi:hypothetical protein